MFTYNKYINDTWHSIFQEHRFSLRPGEAGDSHGAAAWAASRGGGIHKFHGFPPGELLGGLVYIYIRYIYMYI